MEPCLRVENSHQAKAKFNASGFRVLARGANELNVSALGTRRPPELPFLAANVTPPLLNLVAALEAGEVVGSRLLSLFKG